MKEERQEERSEKFFFLLSSFLTYFVYLCNQISYNNEKMKNITLAALASLLTLSSMAQEFTPIMRDHIRNTTDYSQNNVTGTRRVGKLSTAPLTSKGSPKVPVILVQFSDLKFTLGDNYQPQSEGGLTEEEVLDNYHKFCNGTGDGKPYRISGGLYGAVVDYFADQSDSLFMPKFTVVGPVTMPKSYAYYGKGRYDSNISEFYSEACKLAVNMFQINWSDFDNNNDGMVDMVYFIYAGRGANEMGADENYIWPQEGTSTLTVTTESGTIKFGAYGCSAELVGIHTIENITMVQDGIGTICHEISHGLGLPDFYDTSGNKRACMDFWDLMDSGSYQILGNQPCEYTAYERDFMGWRALKEVENDESVTLTLEPMETGGFGYKIINDEDSSGDDYFIIENKQNIGFDMCLGYPSLDYYALYKRPCHGLLITHVRYNESAWTSNKVNYLSSSTSQPRMTIVPADGQLLSNLLVGFTDTFFSSFQGDPFPGSLGVESMVNNESYPSTLRRIITGISEDETTKIITVTINDGSPIPDAINGVAAQKANIQDIFSPAGQKIEGLQKGINIVRYSDGTVKKVFK